MRWILAIGLFAGWVVCAIVQVSPNVVAVWFAFLAGVILFITIGEKMVVEEHGSFWPFSVGAAAFTGLLLILEGIAPAVS
jgi:zinc transporter ZupT